MPSPLAPQSRQRPYQNEPFVVFVEGYSDLHFFAEFMEFIGHTAPPYIHSLDGGRSNLRARAAAMLRPDRLLAIKSVAVLLDADESGSQTFDSARRAITAAVPDLQLDIQEVGKWYLPSEPGPRFGIFIVGGMDGRGELESLAWAAWSESSENKPLAECVDRFTECATNGGLVLKSIDKVRMATALAVLNEEDPRIGPAARARIFDFASRHFTALREFLKPN